MKDAGEPENEPDHEIQPAVDKAVSILNKEAGFEPEIKDSIGTPMSEEEVTLE